MSSLQEPPKRALLLAYSCSPARGGEPGVGWNRALQTARRYETWVICKTQDYEADIRAYLSENGDIPGLHFQFLPVTPLEAFLRRIPGFWYVAHRLWHLRALRLARSLHEEVRFDLVHQVNLCTYREPGYLWRLDAPFVWGPVGGTQNTPRPFMASLGTWGALVETGRSVINRLQLRLAPRVRRAVRAGIIAAANSTVRDDLRRALGVDAPLLLETGVAALPEIDTSAPREPGPARVLWCGVFERRKALPLLLRALAGLSADCDVHLRIIGRGPMERRWRRMAGKLGVEQRCEWLGWLPRAQLVEHYRWADLLAFTSLRDTSGNVMLEALAHGLPVLCLSHQGAGDIVTPECGLPVPVTAPEQVVSDIRRHLEQVAQAPDTLAPLRAGARRRAEHYLWDHNGDAMQDIYEQAIHDYTGGEGATR